MASSPFRFWQRALPGLVVLATACGSAAEAPSGDPGSGGHPTASGGSNASTGGSLASGGTGGSGATMNAGGGGAAATAGSGGMSAAGAGGMSTASGGSSASFWDPSNIPPAQNILMFKFLNRTNGKYPDDKVFWSFKNDKNGINEVHSIAEKPLYDMPGNNSGRMYFYLEAPDSKYYDFIEFTIGGTTPAFNGNTTRVDAFGLKIAMRLHCTDNFDVAVGEDEATFAEDRAVTFQKFLDEAPAEFKSLAMSQAPYRIVEPGGGGFNDVNKYGNYYNSFIDELWSANGLTIAKPGPNGSGLGAYPDISAAIMRHVGATAGTFSADGKLQNKTLWADSTTFYTKPPADYYAKFWHEHGLNGKAYGFPYDDVGGYSSYVSHQNPQYLEVAIGW